MLRGLCKSAELGATHGHGILAKGMGCDSRSPIPHHWRCLCNNRWHLVFCELAQISKVSGAKAQVEAWKARWELGKDKFDELQAKNTELQGLVKNLTMQIEEHATQAALRATSAKIDGVVHAIATANSDIQVYYKEGGKSLKAEPGIFKINPPLSSTEKSG